jgi:putative ABC transport system substrate-binding protein
LIDVVARLLGVVLVSLLALGVVPPVAAAQPSGRVPRIGYLDLLVRTMDRPTVRGLRDGLSELGYVEGQTILIEYRFAEGRESMR